MHTTTQTAKATAHRKNRGNAILELALLGPWVFLLFIGIFDWGFYAVALISLQSAARSAALYTSAGSATASDSATACSLVRTEMSSLPNIGTTCETNPVVTASAVIGPDSANASRVAVTYTSIRLITLPGMMENQFTIKRTVTMRLRN